MGLNILKTNLTSPETINGMSLREVQSAHCKSSKNNTNGCSSLVFFCSPSKLSVFPFNFLCCSSRSKKTNTDLQKSFTNCLNTWANLLFVSVIEELLICGWVPITLSSSGSNSVNNLPFAPTTDRIFSFHNLTLFSPVTPPTNQTAA